MPIAGVHTIRCCNPPSPLRAARRSRRPPRRGLPSELFGLTPPRGTRRSWLNPPSLKSRPTYFRIALPNLIYGFGDDQLAALARSATPVTTPVTTPVAPPVATPVVPPVARPSESLVDEVQRKILSVLRDSVLSASELALRVGISQPKNLRRRYLRLLLDMGFVEYTIPQKPNSRLQKYRLTEKGSALANVK